MHPEGNTAPVQPLHTQTAPPQTVCILRGHTSPGAPVQGDCSKLQHQRQVLLATHPATRPMDFLHPHRAWAVPASAASLSGHSTACMGLTLFCHVPDYCSPSFLSQPSPLHPPWNVSCKARVLQRDKPSRCCLQLSQASAAWCGNARPSTQRPQVIAS